MRYREKGACSDYALAVLASEISTRKLAIFFVLLGAQQAEARGQDALPEEPMLQQAAVRGQVPVPERAARMGTAPRALVSRVLNRETLTMPQLEAKADEAVRSDSAAEMMNVIYLIYERRALFGRAATGLGERLAALGEVRWPIESSCFRAMLGLLKAADLVDEISNSRANLRPATGEVERIVTQMESGLRCDEPMHAEIRSGLDALSLAIRDGGSMAALASALVVRTGEAADCPPDASWALTGCNLARLASLGATPSFPLLANLRSFYAETASALSLAKRQALVRAMMDMARALEDDSVGSIPHRLGVLELVKGDLYLLEETSLDLGKLFRIAPLDATLLARAQRLVPFAARAGFTGYVFSIEAAVAASQKSACDRAVAVSQVFSRWQGGGAPRGSWQPSATFALDQALAGIVACRDAGLLAEHLVHLQESVGKNRWPGVREVRVEVADKVQVAPSAARTKGKTRKPN